MNAIISIVLFNMFLLKFHANHFLLLLSRIFFMNLYSLIKITSAVKGLFPLIEHFDWSNLVTTQDIRLVICGLVVFFWGFITPISVGRLPFASVLSESLWKLLRDYHGSSSLDDTLSFRPI